MPLTDARLVRVEKQLAAVILMLRRAATEGEAITNTDLSSDLHLQLYQLEQIHYELVTRGHKYKHPLKSLQFRG